MSIRLRLTLWYSILLAFTLIILGAAVYQFVKYNTYNEVRITINQQYKQTKIVQTTDFLERVDLSVARRPQNDQVYLQVYNYTNGLLKKSQNLIDNDLELPYPDQTADLKNAYVDISVNNLSFLALQSPIRMTEDGPIIGLLQVAAYTGREEKMLEELRTILYFSSAAVFVIAFIIGMFLSRQALKPIENVIRAADQIDSGSNLSIRIPKMGPNDEIGHLTDTLNGMLTRLETTYNELDDAYKAQRRFVSDASHELRTPLTTIRGNIDLLEKMWMKEMAAPDGEGSGNGVLLDPQRVEISRDAMRDISEESKRMSRLVADMLSLARADAGYAMEKTPVELLPLIEEVVRRAHHLPRTADWIVGDLSALKGAVVQGNADYLRQLLFIFIENAFKYTPSGYVELRGIRSDTQIGLVITDTGIGMDREEVPHIFERFYRADVSRGKTSGTGLGLSIAKWIIDEHEGSVEVKTREGEGTSFIVWLHVSFPGSGEWSIIEGSGLDNG
jgi:two-component system OmpR family sensor kinase